MKVACGLFTAVLVAGAIAVGTAGASRIRTNPLRVASAGLSQEGQQLIWKVELGQPFSPASLKRSSQSLCLLIERGPSSTAPVSLCVSPGRRLPELVYTNGGKGPRRVVPATISASKRRGFSVSFDPTQVGLAYRSVAWQVQSTAGAPDCTAPQACSVLFPARPEVAKLHTPQLVGCAAAGPSLVSGGSTRVHDIALTFDDGPWDAPPPSAFLSILEREHAVATFFEIGRQIAPYDPGGRYERRMLADGDMIGDHSWSHPDVAALPLSQQRFQLLQAIDAIKKATGGFIPCLWRPPYGDTSRELVSLARSLGLITVMWDVDPRDWALPGVNAIYDNVIANAHNGAIVIQHFGGGPRYQTIAALPREIATLRHRGYKFVTVAQMLGLRLIYK